MITHAAFGGSTNLIMHLPAIAHAAKLLRPTVEDWRRVNAQVPRLVDSLPNGPQFFATVQVFLAGGVPEVMLHLRDAGLLKLDVMTVSRSHPRTKPRLVADSSTPSTTACQTQSTRRHRSRRSHHVTLGSHQSGSYQHRHFSIRQLSPDGAVIKSTAIDPSKVDENGIYLHQGPARVFASEPAAIAAIKSSGDERIREGDVVVLIGHGPIGCGMPETAQLTMALKHLS